MEIVILINQFFRFDQVTLTKVLFLGNLSFSVLVALFWIGRSDVAASGRIRMFLAAKLSQTVAWLLNLLGIFSHSMILIDLGYSLLYLGLYFESKILLDMSGFGKKWLSRFQTVIFAAIIIQENILNFSRVEIPVRIVFTSVSIFSMLFIPCIAYLRGSRNSLFKKFIGALYGLLILLSLVRGLDIIIRPALSMRTDEWLQNMALVFFLEILFVGGSGFLLLMKEEADLHIRDLAYFDSLTGLLNRRHFLEEAEIFFGRHSRYEEAISVLFLDIDHFKSVNDAYGHKFGDRVLKDFAALVRKSVRSSDLCCRYGGEEFVIMLSNTVEEKAVAVGKRIQSAMRLSEFPPNTDFAYTVSIGIFFAVPSIEKGDSLESFIEKSDLAMYRAKNNGRDRVEIYGNA
jgi:diguanylate cyclase (GGDEF)-like protein